MARDQHDIDRSPSQGFGLAASIVETVCGLPTIPTKSWCDSAAQALGGLFARSASVVVVCSAMADGSIRRLQGLGVAVRSGGEGPGRLSKAQSGAGSAQSTGEDRNLDRGALDGEMRCGLEGLLHLGWTPLELALDRAEVRFGESRSKFSAPELARSEHGFADSVENGLDGDLNRGVVGGAGLAVRAEDLLPKFPVLAPAAEPWQLSSPFAVFDRARATRVVAGVASIGAPELGRRIAVYVGDLGDPADLGADQSSTAVCADVLSACLPLVARKASLALDRTWTDKGSWLSNREKLVLEQLIIGRSMPEIAAVLQRSHHTVHDNVKSLHRKLAASTRGELIARALGLGGRVLESGPAFGPASGPASGNAPGLGLDSAAVS